jgi:uncharacterized RDD family membrane protein YckC
MENSFDGIMSKKSNQELIVIVSTDRTKYQESAIISAEKEIEIRNIDKSIILKLNEKVKIERTKIEKTDSEITSKSKRIINLLIDLLVIYFFTIFLNQIIEIIFDSSKIFNGIILIFVYFNYYIYLENKFQQTLGKYYTKTKVVKINGEKPTLKSIVFRTFCRIIPWDIISFILSDKGFHDLTSKTLVIKI